MRKLTLGTFVGAAAAACNGFPPSDVAPAAPNAVTVAADPALGGVWSAPFQIGVIAVHSVVLPTGKVMLFSYPSSSVGSSVRLWDPASGNITDVSLTRPRDIHCSGHSFLADGRLFISGGEAYSGEAGEATIENDFFDPVTETFSVAPPLITARWYPTTVELGDGSVLVFGGRPSTVERYDPGSNTITQLPPSANNDDLFEYPRVNLLGNGQIVFSNHEFTGLFDPVTNTWSTGGRMNLGTRNESSLAVLLPGSMRVLEVGGQAPGGLPTATAEIIDFSTPAPAWRFTAPMHYPRQYANAVVLPDGTVLVVGGGQDRYRYRGPVREAELFDPATETWTLMAAQTAPRIYHSTAALLPDGRVLSAGQDRYTTFQTTAEIYSPPYLFKTPRPTIGAAPSAIAYGAAFTVATPDAASIERVALVSPSAVTHADNFDQRYVQLAFSVQDGATLGVTAPPDGNVAPPGWYMLFILSNGVPSVASWVHVAGTGSPPPPPPPPPPDETPPTVTLASPADGSSTSDMTPTFSGMAGTALGDSRIVTVKVFAGGGTGDALIQTNSTERSASGSYSVDASASLALGTYTARAEQMDDAGNTGFSNASTFTVTEPPPDVTPPAITLTAPADGSSTADATPLFSGTAGTAAGDSPTVTVRVFAGTGTGGTLLHTLTATQVGDGSYLVEATSPFALGTYTAQAEQSDAAGNTGFSAANSFTIVQPPPLPPYAEAVLSDAPRAYWRLGEANGTTAGDELGIVPGVYENGVMLGVPGAIAGDANTAARFDGVNDRVNMGDPGSGSLDLGTEDFTVELWLKSSRNAEQAIISKRASGEPYWQVTVTDDGSHVGGIRVNAFDGAVTRQVYGPAIRVDDGTWHHVVVVFDRDTEITIYVDGVAQAAAGLFPGSVSNAAGLLVGKATGYSYFSGDLDEVAIYARALSPEQVRAHLAAGGTK